MYILFSSCMWNIRVKYILITFKHPIPTNYAGDKYLSVLPAQLIS